MLPSSNTSNNTKMSARQTQQFRLVNQKTTSQSLVVDLMANGSNNNLSFSGKKNVKFTWNTAGVTNCNLYVARGDSYLVDNQGQKTISVDSMTPYVVLSCNNITTGVEISDTINISDPKGVVDLLISTNSFTVNAVATLRLPKPTCTGTKLGLITWGDGKSDQVVAERNNSGKCVLEASDQLSYTYKKAGDYTVTFKSVSGTSKKIKVEIGA